jgi:hypothetical protein
VLRRIVLHELPKGGAKCVLHCVLRLLERPQKMPAEREQAAVMALEDRLERGLVARRSECCEAAVLGPP